MVPKTKEKRKRITFKIRIPVHNLVTPESYLLHIKIELTTIDPYKTEWEMFHFLINKPKRKTYGLKTLSLKLYALKLTIYLKLLNYLQWLPQDKYF